MQLSESASHGQIADSIDPLNGNMPQLSRERLVAGGRTARLDAQPGPDADQYRTTAPTGAAAGG